MQGNSGKGPVLVKQYVCGKTRILYRYNQIWTYSNRFITILQVMCFTKYSRHRYVHVVTGSLEHRAIKYYTLIYTIQKWELQQRSQEFLHSNLKSAVLPNWDTSLIVGRTIQLLIVRTCSLRNRHNNFDCVTLEKFPQKKKNSVPITIIGISRAALNLSKIC